MPDVTHGYTAEQIKEMERALAQIKKKYEATKKWRAENLEKAKALQAAWRAANKEKINADQNARYKRMRDLARAAIAAGLDVKN